jgi:hypothetical protein
MKRRNVIAGLVLLAAAVAAFGAYVAFGVDVEAVRVAHDQRFLDDVFAGKRNADDLAKALRPFHKGEPPCAHYAEGKKVDEDEIETIRRELGAAGVADKARATSSIWWRWGHDDERRRHGPVTDEEILTQWRLTATTWESVVAFFASGKLVKAIRANAEQMEKRESDRADTQLADLSDAERSALRAIWERHPWAMSFPQVVQVLMKLMKKETSAPPPPIPTTSDPPED